MKFITEDDLRTIYRDKPFTSFDIEPDEGRAIIQKEIKELYPDYTLQITSDVDIS